jgi:hypothetical protein
LEGDDYITPKEEHAFMREARIRRELILNNMIHSRIMKYLSMLPLMVATMKNNTGSI